MKVKLSATQAKVLEFMVCGKPHGLQSNHYIQGQRGLIRKGLARNEYNDNFVKTVLTANGLEQYYLTYKP